MGNRVTGLGEQQDCCNRDPTAFSNVVSSFDSLTQAVTARPLDILKSVLDTELLLHLVGSVLADPLPNKNIAMYQFHLEQLRLAGTIDPG